MQEPFKFKMEESNQVYKHFHGKKVLVLTNSNFKFNTNCLKVLNKGIFFVDKFGKEIFLTFAEIRLIQEVLEDGAKWKK